MGCKELVELLFWMWRIGVLGGVDLFDGLAMLVKCRGVV